jgi:hypothetical protein
VKTINPINIEYINLFRKYLDKNFSTILSKFHLSTLSNMLAIHYCLTEQSADIKDFLNLSINKVVNFIKNNISFYDSDFSTSLALFILMIQNDNDSDDNEEKSLKNEISETIINFLYKDLDTDKKNLVKKILLTILDSKDVSNLMSFIYSNPSIILDSIQNNSKNNDWDLKKSHEYIKQESHIFLNKKNNKQINYNLSNILTSIFTISTLIIGCTFLGLAGPFLIIPATILGVRIGNKANDLISTGLKFIDDSKINNELLIVDQTIIEKNNNIKDKLIAIDTNEISSIIKSSITNNADNGIIKDKKSVEKSNNSQSLNL